MLHWNKALQKYGLAVTEIASGPKKHAFRLPYSMSDEDLWRILEEAAKELHPKLNGMEREQRVMRLLDYAVRTPVSEPTPP